MTTIYPFAFHSDFIGLRRVTNCDVKLLEYPKDRITVDAKAFGDRKAAFSGIIRSNDIGGVEAQKIVRWLNNFGSYFKSDPMETGEEVGDVESDNVGDVLDRLPFVAQTTHIIDIKRASFSGHVFNLQTESGAYITNGIVTHNCRCWAVFIYSLARLPDDMLTEKGRAELERIKAPDAA